jgi:hypothetical protein
MIALDLGPPPGESEKKGTYIFELPHRSDLPTYTGFDLGVRDDTAIWLVHRVGGHPRHRL